MEKISKSIPWIELSLLAILLLFEVSIHPLGLGPDRRIHDPAVYRLADPGYMAGDWYTTMAVESGVYTFYAKLVNVYQTLPVSEEFWRMTLYLLSLGVLYFSLIKITRLFTESVWVVPIIALFHAIVVVVAPPIWLYGPYIQVDGGLAPRSIGIALSFLALYFLLKQARSVPFILLGLATLVHVSNSLIVFTLFFGAWLLLKILNRETATPWKNYLITLLRQGSGAFLVYLLAGGWFALSVSLRNTGVSDFPDEKFIWTWIYFRAPYMALPLMPWKAWLLFGLHIGALATSWYLLRRSCIESVRSMLDLLALIGLGAVIYFFAFYFFAFIFPWLPGFQFYSLRVIYLMHFVAYLFSALVLVMLAQKYIFYRYFFFSVAALGLLVGASLAPVQEQAKKMVRNIGISKTYLADQETRYTLSPTTAALVSQQEPFLAPPNWYGSPWYLPSVASYKMFGFTPRGLEEWYERMNTVSGGELEHVYLAQKKTGTYEPVVLDWNTLYASLSAEEIVALSKQYEFSWFLAPVQSTYPFKVVAEDSDYRLYQITDEAPR